MLKTDNYTRPLRRLASLYLENGRLLLTEKLTVILAGMAIGMLTIGLGIIMVMFIGFGVVALLRNTMDPFWAYAIVAAVFLIMIIGIVVFRNTLIVNPISRMLSRALLPDPTPAEPEQTESQSTANLNQDENQVEGV